MEGYPGLDRLAFAKAQDTWGNRVDDRPRIQKLLHYMNRLIDLSAPSDIVVVGCGPIPQPIEILAEEGYRFVGVEPVPMFVESANEHLKKPDAVVLGAAENIPLPDESQDVVVFESVLEHVDSPYLALREIHRVLRPGAIAYVTTTDRYRFRPNGHNGEFNVPSYNWLPDLVKECYVFRQLHYEPGLANDTERPAVHWWSYSELCKLGRQTWLRRSLIPLIKYRPWLRALALTQVGGVIFMLKRP